MRYTAKPGDVSLFETEKAGHETAPDHRGYFIAHRDIKAGEKIAISLWAGKANSSRSFSGRVSEVKESAEARPVDLFGHPLPGVQAKRDRQDTT